jgi:membrane-bound lytic murein transglycosylase A
MVAQDTGSAITGPARADIYYGAGAEAGRVSGRFRHNMRFIILVPKSLDPVARGRRMPLPDERPSAKIAKLFPQVDPLKVEQKDRKNQKVGAKPPETPPAATPKGAPGATPARNWAPAAGQPSAAVAQASGAQTAVSEPVPLPEARPNIKSDQEVRGRYYRHYRRGP